MIDSAEEFIRLRQSNEPADYCRATDDTATESVWLDLIERFPEMREWIALNKTLPESVLWRLVRDQNPRVRWEVANRHQITAEMFAELAKDSDDGVRARVCWNKRAPQQIVKRLVTDPSRLVAEAASHRIE